MHILGTTADCNGYAMNTSDGELALRLRSTAFHGGAKSVLWLISDGTGMWYEAQPREHDQLEQQWEGEQAARGIQPHKYVDHFDA